MQTSKGIKMEKEARLELFSAQELDFIVCALLRYQTDLRSRMSLMERFASPEHLESHRAKIALGERLLANLS